MDQYVAAVLGLDIVALVLANSLSGLLGIDALGFASPLVAVGLGALCLAVLAMRGGYQRSVLGGSGEEYVRVITSVVIVVGVTSVASVLIRNDIIRPFVAVTVPIALFALLAGRWAGRQWLFQQRAKGDLVHRVLVVGDRPHVGELVAELRRQPHMGYTVVGACLPNATDSFRAEERIPVLGRLEDVAEAARACGADTVAVTAVPGSATTYLRHLGWSLEGLDVDLLVLPNLTDVAGPRIALRPLAGLPLLHVAAPEFTGPRRLLKATFDRTGALILLLLSAPVLLGVSAAIMLSDRGPVLFRQVRVGTRGELFNCLKFRSMVVDADKQSALLGQRDEQDEVLFKLEADPRVTSLGTILRRYSLDELPQLINVLRGQMSLVGPRPPLPEEVERYGEDVRRRLLVKPGMTGLWQISGRSDLSWNTTVRLDLYYVDNWSLLGDLRILARTARAVVRHSGAY